MDNNQQLQTFCDWKLTCKYSFRKINEVSKCKKFIALKKVSPRGKTFVNWHTEGATNIWKHGSNSFSHARNLHQSWDFWEQNRINRTDTEHRLQQDKNTENMYHGEKQNSAGPQRLAQFLNS